MKASPDSLVVGTSTSNDRGGVVSTSCFVKGTPTGFRVLAGVLLKMAERVDSGEVEKGWGLVLHPDDIPGLRTLEVRSLSLGCQAQRRSEEEDRDGPK